MKRIHRDDHGVAIYPPRVWRWEPYLWFGWPGSSLLVGVIVAKQDGELQVCIGLLVVTVELSWSRALTRREQRQRDAQRIVAEAERIAKEAAQP